MEFRLINGRFLAGFALAGFMLAAAGCQSGDSGDVLEPGGDDTKPPPRTRSCRASCAPIARR